MRYSLSHVIEADADTFWSLFFDKDFNDELYLRHLKYTSYEVLTDKIEPDGSRLRRTECVPKIDLPAPVRAIIGNSTGFTEVGHFDAATRRYTLQVVPAFGGDKITTTSELWVEADGDYRVKRLVTGAVSAKILGVSKLIEGIAERQTREMFELSAEFTNRWLRERR
jgi:hypothetical protein